MSGIPPRLAAKPDPIMILRWGGWGLVLACTFLRALVGTEPLPYWDADPMRAVVIPSGLTPAWSQAVDVLITAGSGVALIGEAAAGLSVSLLWTALILVGVVGVGAHAFVIGGGSLEDARIGSTWVAAICAGLAAMHLCREERIRRVTLAAAVGLVAMLTAKGALQVLYEH